MRTTHRRTLRRGSATVEAAITIPVFLVLVLGMIDLSIGVARYNTLSQAARHGARQASVHGKLAPSGLGGPWGPAAIPPTAPTTGGPAAAEAVAPMLANCSLEESRVQVEWPDGGNEAGSRVRVVVTSPYRPMITFLFGNPAITLKASSTMLISH
jgi:hypothetical protein